MSAQANLAGLFPPQDTKELWNNFILWQPIPVHTMPVESDFLIAGDVPTTCSSYQKAYNEYMTSVEIQEFEESIQPIYDYLTEKTGAKINDFMAVTMLRDSWLCESIHNLRYNKS